jgi:5'-methylthioadenosine phosphorylase
MMVTGGIGVFPRTLGAGLSGMYPSAPGQAKEKARRTSMSSPDLIFHNINYQLFVLSDARGGTIRYTGDACISSQGSGKMAQPGTPPVVGVIGGSGIYEIDGLENRRWVKVDSPFGDPSDELLFGELEGRTMVFLPRHGRGHRIPPSEINFRANIDALKRAGVTEILSMSAVGSLREDLPPGTFVVVDQFIDRTFARRKSFFTTGLAAHVGMGHPVCARLGDALEETLAELNVPRRRGGVYLVMEGPQFSTRAESELYRAWGCDVIGMTNMPEAKLAREAELCYATVAMVTDFDCWHPDHDHVTVDAVIKTLTENAEKARAVVRRVAPRLWDRTTACDQGCHTALENALITAPAARDPAVAAQLDAVAGRVLRRETP